MGDQMLTEAALRMLISLQLLSLRVREERGQTLAEYSLIISAIAVATITIAAITFRNTLVEAWNSASSCLDGTCN
jgi:Flp pilus assembly pilin Flp